MFQLPEPTPNWPQVRLALDLVAQESLILWTLPKAVSDVTVVRIGEFITWRKSMDDFQWRPSVENRELLQVLLEGPISGPVRDVDSCIMKTFRPGELAPGVIESRCLTSVLQARVSLSAR